MGIRPADLLFVKNKKTPEYYFVRIFLNKMVETLQTLSGILSSTVACFIIRFVLLPRYCRPKTLPVKKYESFDNIAVSLCHATVSGIGCLIAIKKNPGLLEDMENNNDVLSIRVAQITTGYFIYDLLDMLSTANWNPINMKEMTVHHFCSILVFARAAILGKYMGLCMLLLNMEVNSIFLHMRALLQYCQFRGTTFFNVASILNIYTNISHRQLIGWQCLFWGYQHTLEKDGNWLVVSANWLTVLAAFTICCLNFKLLYT